MGLAQYREELHQYINSASDKQIQALYKVIANKKDDIIGYSIDGNPLTVSRLNKEIQEAEARIDAGEYVTMEDLEKESENW